MTKMTHRLVSPPNLSKQDEVPPPSALLGTHKLSPLHYKTRRANTAFFLCVPDPTPLLASLSASRGGWQLMPSTFLTSVLVSPRTKWVN